MLTWCVYMLQMWIDKFYTRIERLCMVWLFTCSSNNYQKAIATKKKKKKKNSPEAFLIYIYIFVFGLQRNKKTSWKNTKFNTE